MSERSAQRNRATAAPNATGVGRVLLAAAAVVASGLLVAAAGGIKAAHQAAVNTKWEALCGLRLNQISRER